MLKKILKDMYIAPEILAELPEEQKQILFFKIREEQKRRYYEYEKENAKKASKGKKAKSKSEPIISNKKVKILEDTNGKPWTWIMGEHPNDIPLETLWSDPGRDWSHLKRTNENKSVSKVQAIIFAQNKKRENPKASPSNDSHKMDYDASTAAKQGSIPTAAKDKNAHPPHGKSPVVVTPSSTTVTEKKPSPSLTGNAQQATSQPLVQTNAVNKPSNNDLCENCGPPDSQNQANEMGEQEWQKQLKRFKEADKRRSAHARRASMQVKHLSTQNLLQEKKLSDLRANFERRKSVKDMKKGNSGNPPPLPRRPPATRRKPPAQIPGRGAMPSSREEAEEWFKETQMSEIIEPNDDNPVPKWFHGLISRNEAEQILQSAKIGDFLIRLSDKIWGYALSYKDSAKVKHFLIDASQPNCYYFFGNDLIRHPGLEELITFHKDEPISYGNEILKNEVGQQSSSASDYSGLFQPGLSARRICNEESEITQF